MGSTSQISGLVSGLDTASIISQLMQLEAQPQAMLKNRVASEQTQVSSLQTVNAKIAAIATKTTDLAQLSSWSPTKATSSNDGVTVTATSSATPASLSFSVDSVATGSSVKLATTGTTASSVTTAGPDLTVTFDDGTSWTSSTWTGTGTLQELTNALNDPASGVKATLVKAGVDPSDGTTPTYRLQVASTSTGARSGFTLTSGTSGSGATNILGGVVTSSTAQSYVTTAADTTTAVTAANASYDLTLSDGRSQTFNTGTGSLQDLADAINAGSLATAKVVNVGAAGASGPYRLEVTSADGTPLSIGDGTATPFLGGIYTTGLGADAAITLDGGQTLTSASNTVTGLMPGVDVTLGPGATGSATVTVSRDTQSLSDKVKSMVDAVNSALDDISSLTGYNSSTKTAGLLSGDPTLRSTREQLLDSITTGVGGQSLASVGIQVDKTGKVTFDAAAFQEAYDADPTGTAAKFAGTTSWDGAAGAVTMHGSTWRTQPGTYAVSTSAGTGTIGTAAATVAGNIYTGAVSTPEEGLSLTVTGDVTGNVTYSQGIAAKLEALAQRASNSTDGTLTSAIKGRNADITTMNSSIDDWDVRLADKQDSLQKQFAALEVALGKMQSQASWLSGQIASLPTMGG